MTGGRAHRYATCSAIVMMALLVGLGSGQEHAFSQSTGESTYALDHILVKPKASASEQDMVQIESINGTAQEETIPGMEVRIAEVPDGSTVQEMIDLYEASTDVEYAEPDHKLFLDQTTTEATPLAPNDPDFSFQWGLDNTGQEGGTPDADIDATEAWGVITGSTNTVVAVLDTGVDVEHPDLINNVWTNPDEIPDNLVDDDGNGYVDDVHGWDFAQDDNTVYDAADSEEHGTHVAGIIAAEGDNGFGIAGVNWGAKVMPLKFIAADFGYISDAAEALNYAVKEGVKISNNSYGCYHTASTPNCYSQTLHDAIKDADASGHLFVASAGNSAKNTDTEAHYPSGYDSPNVISVAATNDQDALWTFSNYGPTTVDLAAPGHNIWSTVPGFFDYKSGTSMAAPHVAGVAALVKSQSPEFTQLQVKESILLGVDKKDAFQGKTATGGRLNAAGALAAKPAPPPDTQAPTVTSVSPAVDSDGVSRKTNVEAAFSEEMDATTLTGTFVLTKQGSATPLTATVSYDAVGKKAVLGPSADLEYSTIYTATIKGGAEGAKDLAGNPLAADKVWSFTTAASDTMPPETTITSGPEGYVASNSASFALSSSEPYSTFRCRIDWEQTPPSSTTPPPFEPCDSPKNYASLGEGRHTFEVKAADSEGNVDSTPASRTWFVDTVVPNVGAPNQSFVVPSTLSAVTFGDTVPMKVSWSGSDPNGQSGSGITKYELQRSVNGGAWSGDLLQQEPVPPAAGGPATSTTFSFTLGTTYKFRVRAQDLAGNWSTWTEGPSFVTSGYNQGHSSVTYPAGTWTRVESSGAYGGDLKYATASGARARFSFTGREVAWVAPKGPTRGRAEMWVDGTKVATLDLYSSTGQQRQVVFRRAWATSGSHALVVVLTGTKNASSTNTRVDVDAFIVED